MSAAKNFVRKRITQNKYTVTKDEWKFCFLLFAANTAVKKMHGASAQCSQISCIQLLANFRPHMDKKSLIKIRFAYMLGI